MKKAWVLSYPLSAQRRLIRLGGCSGWSESSLGAHLLCWFGHVAAHMFFSALKRFDFKRWYRKNCDLSHRVTKPTKWHVRPAKPQISLGIRPVWSESSLCAQWVAKDQAFFRQTEKTLIRLGGCPGWSESSLGAQSLCWFCHVAANFCPSKWETTCHICMSQTKLIFKTI